LSFAGRQQNVDNVESVRALGDPPKGFAAVRYRNPTLIDEFVGADADWEDVEVGRTVEVNEVQLYGSAFGDLSGEYELVVVHWQRQSPSNTTATFAVNQTEYRHQVAFEEESLYSYYNVTMEEHLEQPYQTTMWLERGGERVDGVQWRFTHLSNPATQSVDINSQGDLWGFILRNVIITGVFGLLVGFIGARAALSQTGRGPGYGVGAWLMLVAILGLIIGGVAYYQIAVILNYFPYVMGLSFGVVAFAIGLTTHPDVKRIAFSRRELADAQLIPGGPPDEPAADGGEATAAGFFGEDAGAERWEELTEALFLDMPEVPAVRTDEGYKVPVSGLRPFFARLFADAATLNLSAIATRTKVKEGRIDDLIEVDPKYGEALVHKPARLVRVLPTDTIGGDADGLAYASAALQTIAVVIGPAIVGYAAFGSLLNIPWVGVAAGLLVTTVLAYSAENGWIEFEPAPPLYARAEDSLTALQVAYKKADEDQAGRKKAWEEKAKSAAEAREDREHERRTATDKILESFGSSSDVDVDVDRSESKGETPALDEEEDGGFGHRALVDDEEDDDR
jgi:hypothetical protein